MKVVKRNRHLPEVAPNQIVFARTLFSSPVQPIVTTEVEVWMTRTMGQKICRDLSRSRNQLPLVKEIAKSSYLVVKTIMRSNAPLAGGGLLKPSLPFS